MTPQQAHAAVKRAIKRGLLQRPDYCERCGAPDRKAIDGRPIIHGHHSDYNKPLEVEWLCAKCHRAETPLPEIIGAPVFGERNGQAKLTQQAIREILRSCKSNVALGRIYGVHNSTISRIRNGIHWSAAAEGKP